MGGNPVEPAPPQAGAVQAPPVQLPPASPSTPQDISARIGQVLYAIALTSSSNSCNCEVCQLARQLAGLLAQQLRMMRW